MTGRKEPCPHGIGGHEDCSVCDNDPPPYRETNESYLDKAPKAPFNKALYEPCLLCESPTIVRYNINLKAKPICEDCGLTITKQEVQSWKRED